MTTFRADRQFDYDTSLLEQGKYREWFWQGLDAEARTWLRSPTQAHYLWQCKSCDQMKPKHAFTKNMGTARRCNDCVLNNQYKGAKPSTLEDSNRWENKHDVKHWADEAACIGADPEIFDPKSTNEYLDENAEWRKYCPQCPIKDLCIEQIKASTVRPVGIFGGHLFSFKHGEQTLETAKRIGRPKKTR